MRTLGHEVPVELVQLWGGNLGYLPYKTSFVTVISSQLQHLPGAEVSGFGYYNLELILSLLSRDI